GRHQGPPRPAADPRRRQPSPAALRRPAHADITVRGPTHRHDRTNPRGPGAQHPDGAHDVHPAVQPDRPSRRRAPVWLHFGRIAVLTGAGGPGVGGGDRPPAGSRLGAGGGGAPPRAAAGKLVEFRGRLGQQEDASGPWPGGRGSCRADPVREHDGLSIPPGTCPARREPRPPDRRSHPPSPDRALAIEPPFHLAGSLPKLLLTCWYAIGLGEKSEDWLADIDALAGVGYVGKSRHFVDVAGPPQRLHPGALVREQERHPGIRDRLADDFFSPRP